MIEIFVRSKDLTLQTSDIESLSHPCVGPSGQMRAAAQALGVQGMLSYEEEEKIQEIKEFAREIGEQVVIWDLSTLKGKIRAWKCGIKKTPSLIFGAERRAYSLDGFNLSILREPSAK